ncbi:MAG: DUF4870 domain-containing protein, partial [Chloroflexota bacterium]|nr:DUF4870 domain-containing protein [Chloroflexota bacterium]
ATDLTDNDKLMAALSYFLTPIVPVIVLLVESMKARPYQKYHAIQSLGLFVAFMVYSVIACIVYFACTIVTAGILGICLWVIFFVPYIPIIYYTIIAYTRGQYFEIPVITKFMVQQGWLSQPA